MNKILIAALGCVTLSACGGSSGSGTSDLNDVLDDASISAGPDLSTDFGTDNTDFASILNNLRISRGHETVSFDERLGRAAQTYAIEQASLPPVNGELVLSHTGLDGSEVEDRIRAEGYDPSGWAENLAKGHQSQAAVLEGWIASDGHNKNLNADLEDFGLGAAGSGSQLSWVLVLATEK